PVPDDNIAVRRECERSMIHGTEAEVTLLHVRMAYNIIMVLNLMLGLMIPPFGMVLFVMQQVSGLSFEQVVKACLSTLLPLFAVLLLIIFFPTLVTWLLTLIM
ncbi:MAG: TRAP transporter large permease subunit, partial [Desulfobacterales bacterium]